MRISELRAGLPYALCRRPYRLAERDAQKTTAPRRDENPPYDAAIAGSFFHLLDMIDGAVDGDALFFSRDLRVTGDTEAGVAVRDALADFEGSALASAAKRFGVPAGPP